MRTKGVEKLIVSIKNYNFLFFLTSNESSKENIKFCLPYPFIFKMTSLYEIKRAKKIFFSSAQHFFCCHWRQIVIMLDINKREKNCGLKVFKWMRGYTKMVTKQPSYYVSLMELVRPSFSEPTVLYNVWYKEPLRRRSHFLGDYKCLRQWMKMVF